MIQVFKNMRRAQVAIYLLMTIVAITLLALLNVDVYSLVRGKMRVENAGDAAAIAAAHYQGELLNKIGKLNLDHIVYAIANDKEKCDEIVLQQRRLALLGPIEALRMADDAARKNGEVPRKQLTDILMRHVLDIRTIYAAGNSNGADPYPESYPGAWEEYAQALELAVMKGLAVGPDNVEFYHFNSAHPLLNREFYHAVTGSNWCWFKFNARELLDTYDSYRSWWPLPVGNDRNTFENCEIFSLHLVAKTCSLLELFKKEEILELLELCKIKSSLITPYTIEDLEKSYILTNTTQTWFFYNPNAWSDWAEMNPFAGVDDYPPMPVIGEVKEEYDVRGAAAITRCVRNVESVAVQNESALNWTAAAKPFGSLQLDDKVAKVTHFANFVLPSFDNVRLVPIDSVGGRDLAMADYDWVVHIREHLPVYMLRGPVSGSCYYCKALRRWENPMFRQKGSTWLKFHGETCRRPKGSGGHRGGTQHAH
jgi:hypothetical protein